ncbi:aminoglycoside phosphotransferase family protein [Microbacterium sp. SD291]|uniref:aminoglycoside phosphotransferase family protein n=1 Tax=Microbacterium sp. SD291 TaxID=2782007 RepID=UPI001A966534|nr:aminoglycoside phosphotransferase family protein [Microbacterium sp. SD291]MBO0979475.1 aminoglycoside phosphotransferase family protein [Microbacterium sp. SD291]
MADSPTAERALDEAGVRELLRAAAPHLAAQSLRLVAEGWDNAIWRLGDDLAVRLPRRALAVPLIAHEQRALPEVGPRLAALGIRTPMPVLCGTPTAGFPWPWSVVPWIEGAAALGRPRDENTALASPLAEALDALHRDAPADAPVNPVRGVPLEERDDVMRERLDRFRGRTALRDAWSAGLRAPAATERVWIHGDLHPGNILVEGAELAAFIDFGDVTAGDPAYDIAVAWLLFDAGGRGAFRAACGSRYDEATWVRARAWAAYLALVLLAQSDDRPEYLAVGESTAGELALG